jgi:hypothetical protein
LPFAEASADGRYAPLAAVVGDILMARLSDAEGLAFVERAKEYAHARIEFVRFLKEFGDHRLARRAKEKLQHCESRLGNPTEGGQR